MTAETVNNRIGINARQRKSEPIFRYPNLAVPLSQLCGS